MAYNLLWTCSFILYFPFLFFSFLSFVFQWLLQTKEWLKREKGDKIYENILTCICRCLNFFYYPPSSWIASCVWTTGTVMLHLHLMWPCYVALGWVLIWVVCPDWFVELFTTLFDVCWFIIVNITGMLYIHITIILSYF